MINLLNKLIANRKRSLRMAKGKKRSVSSFQIQKMGKFGQQLVVMSR
jgi:hypothetical protein